MEGRRREEKGGEVKGEEAEEAVQSVPLRGDAGRMERTLVREGAGGWVQGSAMAEERRGGSPH